MSISYNIQILILAISSLLLSGCGPTEIDRARSEYVCAQRGGVYEFGNSDIKIRMTEDDSKEGAPATCNNGATVYLPQIISDPNFYPKAKS